MLINSIRLIKKQHHSIFILLIDLWSGCWFIDATLKTYFTLIPRSIKNEWMGKKTFGSFFSASLNNANPLYILMDSISPNWSVQTFKYMTACRLWRFTSQNDHWKRQNVRQMQFLLFKKTCGFCNTAKNLSFMFLSLST